MHLFYDKGPPVDTGGPSIFWCNRLVQSTGAIQFQVNYNAAMPDDQVIRPNIFKQQVLAESARLGSVKLGFEYLIFELTVLYLYFMSGPLYIKQRLELFSQSRLLCLSINDFGHIGQHDRLYVTMLNMHDWNDAPVYRVA